MDEYGEKTRAISREYARFKVKDEYGEGKEEQDKNIREAMYEKLQIEIFESIKTDIYKLEEKNIIEDGQRKIKEMEEEKKKTQLKFILIEGIILGLITGLLVNQITDVISYLKGDKNYQATDWIIVILAILGIVFAFVVYLNKLEEYFTNKKEKE